VTTALKLGEVIVDAVIAKLANGIETRCAAVNQEKNDGVVVEAPHQIFPFGLPGPLAQAPCYVVTEFGESPVYQEDGPHSFAFQDLVAVMIVEEDPDRERVGRKLLRQARAVIECLWDDEPREALAGSAYTLRPFRHIPGPTFEPNPAESISAWRSHYIVVFQAVQQEGD
jgi:hypothetical protein